MALIVVVAIGAAVAYAVLSSGAQSRTESSAPKSSSSSPTPPSATGSSSTSTTLSASCSSTTVSNSNTSALIPSPIPLLTAYDSQTVEEDYSGAGQTGNATGSFDVLYRSATTYKVMTNESLTENGTTTTETATAWILKNGTVLAVAMRALGVPENETGSDAYVAFGGFMGAFDEEVALGANQSLYTDSHYFHSTGNSRVTIGGQSLVVTTYTLNSPDEEVAGCNATSAYYLDTASIGIPAGTTVPVLSSLDADLSITSVSGTTTLDVSIRLLAFVVAP